MRLVVTTPLAVVADVDDVAHVRAEDETGAFGILPGHADFVTVLTVSVVVWRDAAGAEHEIAVRGGALTVQGGDLIEIATREAVSEPAPGGLGEALLARFQHEEQETAAARVSSARLHLAAIRRLQRYVESGRRPMASDGDALDEGARSEAAP